MENENPITQEKANMVAQQFLMRRGYEVVDVVDGSVLVAIDSDDEKTIVFIDVVLSNGAIMQNTQRSVSSFENIAIRYLSENDQQTNRPIRFDVISLKVLGSDKAMIRHHVNAMSGLV